MAAETLAPAHEWRVRLAVELQKVTGAVFAAVFTCPPGDPHQVQVDVCPASLLPTIHRIHSEFLPRIERARAGITLAPGTLGRAYAPLAEPAHQALAEELRRDVLAPVGVQDLVNVFFLDDAQRPLGWIALGTAGAADELLSWAVEPLSFAAGMAARTLQGALALAAACGAAVDEPIATDLERLSPRERQVAGLIARGLSDANIAARLGIGEETVGSHLRRIFQKLGLRSRVDLAARLSSLSRREFLLGE